MTSWFSITAEQAVGIIASSFFVYFTLMVIIRLNGLRSFAKMSAHGFAVTIAVGSLLGATILQKEPSILQGILAIGTLLGLQTLYSVFRLHRQKPYLENQPVLLMDGDQILYNNLKKVRVTENDLMSKLREANVLQLSEVKAVVFEATGDVSVLHGDKNIDQQIMQDVRAYPETHV